MTISDNSSIDGVSSTALRTWDHFWHLQRTDQRLPKGHSIPSTKSRTPSSIVYYTHTASISLSHLALLSYLESTTTCQHLLKRGVHKLASVNLQIQKSIVSSTNIHAFQYSGLSCELSEWCFLFLSSIRDGGWPLNLFFLSIIYLVCFVWYTLYA